MASLLENNSPLAELYTCVMLFIFTDNDKLSVLSRAVSWYLFSENKYWKITASLRTTSAITVGNMVEAFFRLMIKTPMTAITIPINTSTIRVYAISMDKLPEAKPFNRMTCVVIKITAKA